MEGRVTTVARFPRSKSLSQKQSSITDSQGPLREPTRAGQPSDRDRSNRPNTVIPSTQPDGLKSVADRLNGVDN
jgi:hypothetical protein